MSARLGIAVVIPVHNEEEMLAACLDSVQDAADAARERFPLAVVVVLDACTDRSADIAARYPFTVVRTSANLVGAARRAGIERARAALGAVDRRSLWIAGTDADSVVPQNWITHQAELALGGADVMLGTVRPDFAGLTREHVEHWHATHPPGIANGNVHGANLGIRGSVYDAALGFDPVPEHEDVLLVDRARAMGAVVVASAGCCVQTSSRFIGRTPGGYSAFLRNQAASLACTAGTP